ncbi:hypothetical protein CERSUDRAFT_116489 [Gelatoporia subvermispora B]|uniref:Uncharacterized protein n=1 Tax=Ceriporiopsis subvermispora (strain B) TaxID=914234 RepID=M2QSF7_CERS8|nr:hypothetical protein CERSUDRAFT_116489 [Gelatoporia subvermispora B]
MKSVYVALATSPTQEDDHEAKPLVQSNESNDELPSLNNVPLRTLSRLHTVVLYILCTLVVVFAGLNLVMTAYAACYTRGHHSKLDDLPRPDIFVGLPSEPRIDQAHASVAAHDHHSHVM